MKYFLHASAIVLLWLTTIAAGLGGLYTGSAAVEERSVLLGIGSIALLCVVLLAFLVMYRLIGAYRRRETGDQLPDELTTTLTFRPNPRKWGLFLTVSLAIATWGVLTLPDGDVLGGALVTTMGSIGVIVSGWYLLPGKAYLRISRDGLTVRNLHRTGHFAWHEVCNFHAEDASPRDNMLQRRIYFDLTAGGWSFLPDCYGLNPLQLALELNHYCELYGSPPIEDEEQDAYAVEPGYFPATLN